jgi:hypothetical protein
MVSIGNANSIIRMRGSACFASWVRLLSVARRGGSSAYAHVILPHVREDGSGQQPVAPMPGGMPAVECLEGLVKSRFVPVRMRLTTVQAAQTAHRTRGAVLHHFLTQRAALEKELGPSVCAHGSSLHEQVSGGLCQPHLRAPGLAQEGSSAARG